MEIIVGWVVFSLLVGVAASGRGRSGAVWFLLALLISPLVGFILVIALPRVGGSASHTVPGGMQRTTAYRERRPPPFVADGVLGGIPYRVIDDGAIEAMMPGGLVRFRDMDQFLETRGPDARP